VTGAAAYRVYCRTDAAPNTDYSENQFNALAIVPSGSFATTVAITFTDQIAALAAKRPFFPSGICRAVLTLGEIAIPGTYRTFYDAIFAFDPTYVQKILPANWSPDIIGSYYSFAAWLEIGDGATTTYFHDRDSCVFILGGHRYGVNAQAVTWNLGEYDPVTGRRSRGSAVYIGGYGSGLRPGSTLGSSRMIFGGINGCDFNDSYVEDIGLRGMIAVPTGQGTLSCGTDSGVQLGNDGLGLNVNLRGTEVAGLNANPVVSVGTLSVVTIRDLYLRSCWSGWPYSVDNPAQFDNVVIEDSVVGLHLASGGAVQRFVGLRVLGRTEGDIYVRPLVGRRILRDAIFGDAADNEDPLLRQVSAAGGTIEYESLVEVAVVDAVGAAISGASVLVLDSAGTVLASGTTDGSGTIIGGLPVSYLIYAALTSGVVAVALMSAHVAAANYSKVDKRPMTLRITVPNYDPVNMVFSPVGSVNYRIVMDISSARILECKLVNPTINGFVVNAPVKGNVSGKVLNGTLLREFSGD
jgi:hypothetical protein